MNPPARTTPCLPDTGFNTDGPAARPLGARLCFVGALAVAACALPFVGGPAAAGLGWGLALTLRRDTGHDAAWALVPVLLWLVPPLLWLWLPAEGLAAWLRSLGLCWLVLGVATTPLAMWRGRGAGSAGR